MNYKLIIPIFIVAILAFWYYKSKTKVSSGIMEDWNRKVKSAKLNEVLFNNADLEEKEELIYNFTQKLRQVDNYGKGSFENMPKTLRAAYLINELEAEVNNGGYLQFFTNSSGQYTEETIETLDLIGAKYNKGLMEKAVQTLKKHNESTEKLNEKINTKNLYESFQSTDFYDNEELLEEMHKLDLEFYEYKEDISKLKMDYLEKNSDGLWIEIAEKYGS